MPTVVNSSAIFSGDAWIDTPKQAKTSALPERLEILRLPCFAIVIPPAAKTKAAVVETLKLLEWSPPVPQLSMASPPS